jgi:hypothetical protein
MNVLKKHITEILIWFVVLSVISLLVLGFVLDFKDTPSPTTICKEIGHGNYQNLDKLLKPDSSLKKLNLTIMVNPSIQNNKRPKFMSYM